MVVAAAIVAGAPSGNAAAQRVPEAATRKPNSILAATASTAPDSYRPDGVSILPMLRGEAPVLERRVFWRVEQPVRRQRAVKSGHWKPLIDGNAVLLFDLDNNPGERRDLAAQHPDTVLALRRLYSAWESDIKQEGQGR